MTIRLLAGTVTESNEVRPGVVFDLDADGRVLGIEMLDVSKRTDNPIVSTAELVCRPEDLRQKTSGCVPPCDRAAIYSPAHIAAELATTPLDTQPPQTTIKVHAVNARTLAHA